MNTDRLRILQLVGNLDASGAETVVVNLANGLHDRGHVVSVCSRTTGPLAPRLRAPLHIVPKRATLDWTYVRDLCALVRELNVEVIHSHLFGSDLYGVIVATLTGRALVSTIHGADAIRTAKRRLAYHAIGRRADRLVAVSDALYEQFSRAAWAARGRVVLISNGVAFSDASRRGNLRGELGLRPDQPVVGAVGNIKRVKGYEVLVAAFARLRSERGDAVLLVAGANEDEAYQQELLDLVSRSGLDGAVRFLGSRADVPDLLRTFDVYVVASHYEGTSLALLEAMGAGVPVVATSVGGNPAVVKDGRMGLLVPPRDADALAAAIGRIVADPVLGTRLGRAGAESVRSSYGLDLMVERYESLCHEVTRARRQNPGYGRRFLRASC